MALGEMVIHPIETPWYSFERYCDKLSGGTIILDILPILCE
jgi:hypothetical protein